MSEHQQNTTEENTSNDQLRELYEQFKSFQNSGIRQVADQNDEFAKYSVFKFNCIMKNASFNERMIGLGVSTLLISLVSKKIGGGVFSTLRNTVLGYGVVGTVLVPEVFNPFLYQKK